MGTPEFACNGLMSLAQSPHKILGVVTVPDNKSGRGQKLSACEVKLKAMSLNLPVFQPGKLTDKKFLQNITEFNADIFVVIAFRILPKKLYSIPKFGAINIHASLLPKYRGAAPINHAILNGESETGLTSFFLSRKVDCGKIIARESTAIGENENYSSLYQRLSEMSGQFLIATIDKISQTDFKPVKQDITQSSPAPKISTEDCLIDWSRSGKEVHNHIRAFSEKPGAFCYLNDKKLKILESRKPVNSDTPELNPGEFAVLQKKLFAGTGNGLTEIIRLQPEGKKVIDAPAFINGYMTTSDKRLTTHGRR